MSKSEVRNDWRELHGEINKGQHFRHSTSAHSASMKYEDTGSEERSWVISSYSESYIVKTAIPRHQPSDCRAWPVDMAVPDAWRMEARPAGASDSPFYSKPGFFDIARRRRVKITILKSGSNYSRALSRGGPVTRGEKDRTSSAPVEFKPSTELAGFVLEGYREQLAPEGSSAEISITQARAAVRNAFSDLMFAMADSLRRLDSGRRYPISTNYKLEVNVAKAILARINIDFYSSVEFIRLLFDELSRAAIAGELRGKGWEVTRTSGGELILDALEMPKRAPPSRPPLERATFLKLEAE